MIRLFYSKNVKNPPKCKRPWFDSWVGKMPGVDRLPIPVFLAFPGGSDGIESACSVGELGFITEWGRSPRGGHRQPTAVFLPGESPWTEELGGIQQSMGSQRVDHN